MSVARDSDDAKMEGIPHRRSTRAREPRKQVRERTTKAAQAAIVCEEDSVEHETELCIISVDKGRPPSAFQMRKAPAGNRKWIHAKHVASEEFMSMRDCEKELMFTVYISYKGEKKGEKAHGKGETTWSPLCQTWQENFDPSAFAKGRFCSRPFNYAGDFQEGCYHGQGTATFKSVGDGRAPFQWSGEWRNGRPVAGGKVCPKGLPISPLKKEECKKAQQEVGGVEQEGATGEEGPEETAETRVKSVARVLVYDDEEIHNSEVVGGGSKEGGSKEERIEEGSLSTEQGNGSESISVVAVVEEEKNAENESAERNEEDDQAKTAEEQESQDGEMEAGNSAEHPQVIDEDVEVESVNFERVAAVRLEEPAANVAGLELLAAVYEDSDEEEEEEVSSEARAGANRIEDAMMDAERSSNQTGTGHQGERDAELDLTDSAEVVTESGGEKGKGKRQREEMSKPEGFGFGVQQGVENKRGRTLGEFGEAIDHDSERRQESVDFSELGQKLGHGFVAHLDPVRWNAIDPQDKSEDSQPSGGGAS